MPSPPLSIVQSLSPRIAILASDDVTDSCQLNGCQGLEELLRPWEGGTERVSILSSTLTPTIHPSFPLRFVSHKAVYSNPSLVTPNPDLVVDLVGSFVGAKRPEDEQHYALTRSLILSSRPLAPYETFNHPVGVLLAISTSTPNPLDNLTKLYGQAVSIGAQSAPWLDGVQVMRFFVVVHDTSKMGEDLTPANELLGHVKKAYGPHSTLLVINSLREPTNPSPSPNITMHPSIPLPRPPSALDSEADPTSLSQVYASALSSLTLTPSVATASVSNDPPRTTQSACRKLYASKLDAEDAQRLVGVVRELVVQSLVPWMEARVREWNEVYHANRRGITGRLFGAGRKLFGGSRPNSPQPGSQAGYNAVKGYYPVNSVEALSRRLADFAFMLRDYKYAGSIYDSLRRDFAQDRAWRYASAATEMYGLSLLLSHPYFSPTAPPTPHPFPFTTLQHNEISSWLEQAVLSYLNRDVATQIQLDALRITILYYEAWKAINEWRGVSAALIRSAGEADEVPAAVIIEEAAGADVKGGKISRGKRKQALHLTMAARRYETAGLKTFSRRCLDRASELLRAAAWTAARDRIEYSLGRQAYTLGESDVAVEHFLRLLQREDTGAPGSQGMVLEDMALAYEQLVSRPDLLKSAKEKLVLPTPVFDVNKTQIILPSQASTSGSGSIERWAELNTQALSTWDRKGKKPMSLLPDDKRTVVAVGETFHVNVVASNPLNAPVILSDLTLIADESTGIEISTIPEQNLEPYETRTISITVTPNSASSFTFTHVSFLFHRFFPVCQSLIRKGKRLHATKAQRLNPTYAKDTTRDVVVENDRPRISVEVVGLSSRVMIGEEVEAEIRLENLGKIGVEMIQLVMNEFGVVRLRDTDTTTKNMSTSSTSTTNRISPNLPLLIHTGPIEPGQSVTVPITFTALTIGWLELLSLVIFNGSGSPDAIGATPISIVVEIVPGVLLSTAVKPARDGSYLVFLEAFNQSNVPISITGFTVISQIWSATCGEYLTGELLPNQTMRTTFSITRNTQALLKDINQTRLLSDLGALLRGQPESIHGVGSDEQVSLLINNAPESCSLKLESFVFSRRQYRLDRAKVDFPTISSDMITKIIPLFDIVDLDFGVSFTILDQQLTDDQADFANPLLPLTKQKSGWSFSHGHRIAPDMSLVEGLKMEMTSLLEGSGKRTMYEETGRLRKLLERSVLDGVLAKEDDPVSVWVNIVGGKNGKIVVRNLKEMRSAVIKIDFELRNRSLRLPVRWVLRLPQPSLNGNAETFGPNGNPASFATYTGTLNYRGMLKAGEASKIRVEIWVTRSSLISLAGWVLDVETGEMGEGEGEGVRECEGEGEQGKTWMARLQWTRVGQGPLVDVRDE